MWLSDYLQVPIPDRSSQLASSKSSILYRVVIRVSFGLLFFELLVLNLYISTRSAVLLKLILQPYLNHSCYLSTYSSF